VVELVARGMRSTDVLRDRFEVGAPTTLTVRPDGRHGREETYQGRSGHGAAFRCSEADAGPDAVPGDDERLAHHRQLPLQIVHEGCQILVGRLRHPMGPSRERQVPHVVVRDEPAQLVGERLGRSAGIRAHDERDVRVGRTAGERPEQRRGGR